MTPAPVRARYLHAVCSRRDLLGHFATGLGGMALTTLLARDVAAQPHHPPRARRVIQICLQGGLSQVDSFDYKPALEKLHGKSVPGGERPQAFMGKVGRLHKAHFAFRRRGASGLWVSDLFPHLAGVADELTVLRSMYAETSNHTPATFQENSGFRLNGFPSLGAWLSYGLGSESDDLPAFVVIPDARQLPPGGSINWTNGFLPARHQGVVVRATGTPIDDLHPARPIPAEVERASRLLRGRMNRRHLDARGGEDVLAARLRSYELAARMQLAVPVV